MSKSQVSAEFPDEASGDLNSNFPAYVENDMPIVQNDYPSSLNELSELVLKTSDEILLFILNKKYNFLSLIQESGAKQDMISYAIIALGKACSSELHKDLNNLLLSISSNVNNILINMQQYLVSLKRQESIENLHLDSLFYLTVFLRNFQLTLPSASLDFISVILPLVTLTCKKHLKNRKDLDSIVSENLKEIDEELKLFTKHFSAFEIKTATEKEKLHLLEPPDNFRSLSVLPTLDDILLPCSFLRPNIVKGKYNSAEHYLDVQFRLLKEDYIKPLRDGIAEYLCLKKDKKSFKNCKSVQVYSDVTIVGDEFIKGNLIHTVKFAGQNFSSINWENSKRLLTGSLLCLSSDDFHSILFATVVHRDLKILQEGLLRICFEEITEDVLNLTSSINFVMIETTSYFVAYCHNLKALQTLNDDLLPMKRYIIDVEKTINCPEYLLPTTTFDMRPLLIPLHENHIALKSRRLSKTVYNYPADVVGVAKSITVRDDNCWPSASDLNLDESQLNALKSAVTKEFAIIQGPPGTGKTYVGLRVVQLLLHNINKWFNQESNSLPILIVCYTNHALDQFLEGVLLFTEKIVRIGGRGTNETVAKYQINKLVESCRYRPQELSNKISEIRSKITTIKNKLNKVTKNLEESPKYLIRQSDIEGCIPSAHLHSLKKGDFKLPPNLRSERNSMEHWLEAINIHGTSFEEEHQNKNFNTSISDTNEEVENGIEADVKFIEDQRNIDFFDFEELEVLKKSEKDGWKSQERSKHDLKYIRNMLEHSIPMKRHQAMKVKNVWVLPIKLRWQLYKFWLEMFIEGQQKEYLELQTKLKVAFKDQSDLYAEQDFSVLRGSHVVGMTTTGAAKYRHIIRTMKPAILIVEEAAEILESHIITSLAPETQHVILIGDQQQLRPSPSVYMLAVKYDMNVSLFERMIKNGVDYCRLSIQHRMRPEIAALIVPHIYSNLQNHEVVTKFDNIKGVGKNVFFVSHNFNELFVKDSKSKVNEHEAKFLIKFCKYLIFQGYKPSQITVLTTYLGQLFALKKLVTDEVKDVRFTVVDNFQGEENDIILISFVRSNNEGEVGFLKVPNRVCVALSRAKKGLYCIGNFDILAQKSKLWKNIVQTLTVNHSIGPSLQLMCQNHPEVFHEVADDTDFAAVPDGGCSEKCNYRLQCGHSCPLFCHPYDRAHEFIQCKKPCNTVCNEGHQCPKKCFEECGSCVVTVDKTLSLCKHTVRAPCGLCESEIVCREPCIKTCDRGHKCPKKCFEYCECPVIIDRALKCGHTIPAKCGLLEWKIKCPEPCIKTCDRGHTCPKKCFEDCKYCPVIIDRALKCGHTIPAECGLYESEIVCREPCIKTCDRGHKCPKKCFEYCKCLVIVDRALKCGHTIPAECGLHEQKIKCPEPCIKTCDRGHTCPKKCFEDCEYCPVIMDKTLKCGHTIPIACGLPERKIKCYEPCSKTCSKGHKCQKKCFETCGSCKFLVDKILKKCGHTVKAYCGMSELALLMLKCDNQCSKTCNEGHQCGKKCYEVCGPCTSIVNKTLSHCGHTVKVPCSKDKSKIICNMKCSKILSCGHECMNKCSKPCVSECIEGTEIESPVCGHILKVECSFTQTFEELQEICSTPCNTVLPCGHMCKGTCGSCYQGRLHVECQEDCERVLVCGHKCSSKCSKSCPPCEKPCENRCVHSKCRRKCGIPCVKCFKMCDWICSHKKCTRRCYEICNREPCDEPCMKLLPCTHPCVGYCGEPCPKQCRICNKKLFKDISGLKVEEQGIYIYLEDCGHIFKECDLNKCLNSGVHEFQKIEMKTCPKCRTVIRRNVRFSKLVKTCLASIEKIKLIAMYDKEVNLEIQRSLLKHPQLSCISNNDNYKPVMEAIKSENIRDVQDLMNTGNILNIAIEIESMRYDIFSMFVSRPFLKSFVYYARFCRVWLSEFICNNFLTVSEYQLEQLSDEIYRLTLIDMLLKFASEKFFATFSPAFENCVQCVLNFKPFSDDSITKFENAFQSMITSFVGDTWSLPVKSSTGLTVVNMSGNWFSFLNGGISCFANDNFGEPESNLPSNTKKQVKHNLIMPSDLLFSSTSGVHDIGRDESESDVEADSCKQLYTYKKSANVFDQNTEVFHAKCREPEAFLQSLLSKKLKMMCKVEKAQINRSDRNENYNKLHANHRVSETAAKSASLPYHSYQQTTKQLFRGVVKQSRHNDYRSMSQEKSRIYSESDTVLLNQAKNTGAVPKNSKLYHGFHEMEREQNKSYNFSNYNLRNTSKYPTEDKAYQKVSRIKPTKAQSNPMTNETTTYRNYHSYYSNRGSGTISKSQNSSISLKSFSDCSKYGRNNEEGSLNKTYSVLPTNSRAHEPGTVNTSRSYRSRQAPRGRTDRVKSQSSVAEGIERSSDAMQYDKHSALPTNWRAREPSTVNTSRSYRSRQAPRGRTDRVKSQSCVVEGIERSSDLMQYDKPLKKIVRK